MDLLDDLKHPSGGEQVDRAARDAVRLAHRVLERFPDVVKRHRFIAGGAAVSSALVVLAGVAVARRVKRGESPDEAVEAVTEDELRGLRIVETVVETEASGIEASGAEAAETAGAEASGGGIESETDAETDVETGSETGEDQAPDGEAGGAVEEPPSVRRAGGGA